MIRFSFLPLVGHLRHSFSRRVYLKLKIPFKIQKPERFTCKSSFKMTRSQKLQTYDSSLRFRFEVLCLIFLRTERRRIFLDTLLHFCHNNQLLILVLWLIFDYSKERKRTLGRRYSRFHKVSIRSFCSYQKFSQQRLLIVVSNSSVSMFFYLLAVNCLEENKLHQKYNRIPFDTDLFFMFSQMDTKSVLNSDKCVLDMISRETKQNLKQ